MTELIIVAPGRLHREGLRLLLGAHPRLRVAAAVADAGSAVTLARVAAPDAVLVDVAGGGAGLVRRVVEALPDARVVALGAPDDGRLVVECARAGVAGYVDADVTLPELAELLDAVAGDPGGGAPILLRIPAAPPAARLTCREAEVLELVDEGLSNKEIAARLHIRLATVKNHVHNVLDKLQVSGRGAAAARTRALRAQEGWGERDSQRRAYHSGSASSM